MVVAAYEPVFGEVVISVVDRTKTAGLVSGNIGTEGETPVFDFNRDRLPDILVGRHSSSDWPLMRNNGDGTFSRVLPGTFFKQDRHGCVAADFGSLAVSGLPDGRPDLYCVVGACQGTCQKEYANELFIQHSNGTFRNVAQAWGVADVHGRGREAHAVDVNRDGLMDIVVANAQPTPLIFAPNRIYLNRGGAFLELVSPVTVEINSTCIASMRNATGRPDLLFCTSNGLLRFPNIGGTYGNATKLLSGVRDAEIADVSGNGVGDLIAVGQSIVQVWFGTATGTFPKRNFAFALVEGRDAAVCDLTGDGKADVYVAQGKNALYRDVFLVNKGSCSAYTRIAVPDTRVGNGDVATCFPNWNGSGGMAVFVTNGKWTDPASPDQLLAVIRR